MAFEQPLLQIEIFQQGQWQPFSRNGRREDDQGFDLAVRWLGANRYKARWYHRQALNSPLCRARP
jgi:hypothetical protein